MSFRPLQDRVLVRRDEEAKKTTGGLFIPDDAKEKPVFGTIVAVGPGRVLESGELLAMDEIEVGSRVVFHKFAGTELDLDGKKLLILKEEDILAVEL